MTPVSRRADDLHSQLAFAASDRNDWPGPGMCHEVRALKLVPVRTEASGMDARAVFPSSRRVSTTMSLPLDRRTSFHSAKCGWLNRS
jgi:hypothetical protein